MLLVYLNGFNVIMFLFVLSIVFKTHLQGIKILNSLTQYFDVKKAKFHFVLGALLAIYLKECFNG